VLLCSGRGRQCTAKAPLRESPVDVGGSWVKEQTARQDERGG
jgi:hypothetical protein